MALTPDYILSGATSARSSSAQLWQNVLVDEDLDFATGKITQTITRGSR
jgi:hypothetical protein